MNKLIIGLIGEHGVGKTVAANTLKNLGFHKLSISSKVEDVAQYLFSKDEIKHNRNTILNEVRRRGIKVCKEYWLNLILVTLPSDTNLIVFDDFSIDEASVKKVKTIQIIRPSFTTLELPDLETIVNDSSLNDFKAKIEELGKKLPRQK